jgi:hypothetical protein
MTEPFYAAHQLAELQEGYYADNRTYEQLLGEYLSLRLTSEAAYEYARHGFVRRLGTLKRCAYPHPHRRARRAKAKGQNLGRNAQAHPCSSQPEPTPRQGPNSSGRRPHLRCGPKHDFTPDGLTKARPAPLDLVRGAVKKRRTRPSTRDTGGDAHQQSRTALRHVSFPWRG